jgi:hypothetical protein
MNAAVVEIAGNKPDLPGVASFRATPDRGHRQEHDQDD